MFCLTETSFSTPYRHNSLSKSEIQESGRRVTPFADYGFTEALQAIWRKSQPGWYICGIPQVLYTDHGSDFTSRHIEQVAADLKIRLIFSTGGKPRGRGKGVDSRK